MSNYHNGYYRITHRRYRNQCWLNSRGEFGIVYSPLVCVTMRNCAHKRPAIRTSFCTWLQVPLTTTVIYRLETCLMWLVWRDCVSTFAWEFVVFFFFRENWNDITSSHLMIAWRWRCANKSKKKAKVECNF